MTLPVLVTLASLSMPLLEIVEPATYHADEVQLPERSPFLALCGGRLDRVEVVAERVNDALLDEDGEASGWSLRAPCEAALLIREPSTLRPGAVRAATVLGERGQRVHDGPPDTLSGLDAVEVQLGAARYEVVREVFGDSGGFRLVLRERGRRTVLYETETSKGGHWSISWAGDLDGDGALDLVLEAASHYNVREVRLFLSGGTEDRAPVQVGLRRSVGC